MREGYLVFTGRVLANRRSVDHAIRTCPVTIRERQRDQLDRRPMMKENHREKSQMRQYRSSHRSMIAEALRSGLDLGEHAIHTLS